jgi:hypothetical protein
MKTSEDGKIFHAHGSAESILENDYTAKTIYMFNVTHQNFNNIFHSDRKINPKVHTKTQKTLNSQSRTQQKRAMLEVSQYLSSNYIAEP